MNKKVGALAAQYHYVKGTLLNVAHKLLIQRARGRGQISKDYDQGEWLDLLNDKQWQKVDSIKQYLLPKSDGELMVLMDGEPRVVDLNTYYEFRAQKLEEVLKYYSNNAEEIVELGSGAGRNLLTLGMSGKWKHLKGYELSDVGMQVTKDVARHFGLEMIDVEQIDLLNISDDVAEKLCGKTAFTYYCLEQLPNYTEQILRSLAKVGVKRVIHIEPSTELFSWWRPKDLLTISYIWRQDYQKSVLSTAQNLEAEGLIKIVDAKRLNYAPSLRNDPTLVVWETL